jgi:hypothetical protein
MRIKSLPDIHPCERETLAQAPKSVIHIKFLPTNLAFEPRAIWAAVEGAASEGRLPSDAFEKISGVLGETAIHIATRDYIMRAAIRELKSSVAALCDLVPTTLLIDELRRPRVISAEQAEPIRDRALLAINAFLFEYRVFLDLLAKFCYEILRAIGKTPISKQTLRSGIEVNLMGKSNRLNEHAFLLYLCDLLQAPSTWFEFLNKHRNSFTHAASPYCAIEDRLMFPPEYDLIIMRRNIVDFSVAPTDDYFRLSECAEVHTGIRHLASAAQKYLTDILIGLQ